MSTTLPTVSVPLRYNDDGTIFIGDTKVMLEQIVYAFRQGESPEQIRENYRVLLLSDVYAVCTYYLQNRDEIDAYMKRQEKAEQQLIEQIRQEFPLPESLKAKLRAARDEKTRS